MSEGTVFRKSKEFENSNISGCFVLSLLASTGCGFAGVGKSRVSKPVLWLRATQTEQPSRGVDSNRADDGPV